MSRTLTVKTPGGGRYKELALVNPEAASDQIEDMQIKFTKYTKVLDLYSRDETYLKMLEQKIYESIQDDSEFDADTEEEHNLLVRKHIRQNQLFAICTYKECVDSINKCFNNMIPYHHILWHSGRFDYLNGVGYISEYVRDWSGARYNLDRVVENIFIQDTLNHVTLRMGFDVVVGFLPENNTFIDFMHHGCMLCRGKMSVITPTTWFDDKPGSMNSEYRKQIKRYIKIVTYFPNSRDVADVDVYGGLSRVYMNSLVDYDRPDDGRYRSAHMWTKAHSYTMDHLCTKETMNTSLNVVRDLNPVLNELKKRLEKSGSELVKPAENDDAKSYRVAVRNTLGKNVFYDKDNRLHKAVDAIVLKPKEECPKRFKMLMTCSSLEKAESLSSYINTTPVQYVLAISAIIKDTCDARNWRCIPMPDKLDHTYTDEEVYELFGFIPKQIEIIKRTMEV